MSPVLLIVLAALWAAVLIPATVNSRTHHHDDRTMNGFSTAMRTLSRRSMATADRRTILVPGTAVTDERRRAERDRLARRRAMFGRLVVAALLSAVLAVALRGAFVWVHVGLDLAVVGAVVKLRREAVREAARARAERRARLAEREAAEYAAYQARQRRAEEVAARRASVVVHQDLTRRRVVGG